MAPVLGTARRQHTNGGRGGVRGDPRGGRGHADALDAADEFEIDIIGDHRRAVVLPEVPYDPSGALLRS